MDLKITPDRYLELDSETRAFIMASLIYSDEQKEKAMKDAEREAK